MKRELGFELTEIAVQNLAKLGDRRTRGVIASKGDNRVMKTEDCTCRDNYADEDCPEHGRNGRLGVDWTTNYEAVPSMDPTGYGV